MLKTGVVLRENGLVAFCPFWRERLGLLHGVTTRTALPHQGKEDLFTVVRRARQVEALPPWPVMGAQQVHGARIGRVDSLFGWNEPSNDGVRWDPELKAGEFQAADALVTTVTGMLIVIQTADCLPVFLLDERHRVAGLAHCGWRGLRQDLAAKTVRAMLESGATLDHLEAWLAPCIQAAQYEVGPELVHEFEEAFPGLRPSPDGRSLDLPAIACWQLEQAGLPEGRILNSGECTRARSDRYHSYRGEGENAGRILSFIGFNPG